MLGRFEELIDRRGLVPLEYQDRMRPHQTALKRLDAALKGEAPRWTAAQAQEARGLLGHAHQAYMATCQRVADWPVEERRELARLVQTELDSHDKVQRTIVEVIQLIYHI